MLICPVDKRRCPSKRSACSLPSVGKPRFLRAASGGLTEIEDADAVLARRKGRHIGELGRRRLGQLCRSRLPRSSRFGCAQIGGGGGGEWQREKREGAEQHIVRERLRGRRRGEAERGGAGKEAGRTRDGNGGTEAGR